MARRIVVTNGQSSAWKSSFSFRLEADTLPEVTALKALGVHYVSMRIGCTRPGEFFTDLIQAIPKKGVAGDVMWHKRVRDLCESMTPEIIENLQLVVVPEDDDPDSNHQEVIATGNYLLSVDSHCSSEETWVTANVYFPAAEAEIGSPQIRRETRNLPVPPSRAT